MQAARAVGYVGAGTVEFILDQDSGEYYFLEMNTRLQVEHPITEMITGQDLVEWQLRVASGERLPLSQEEIPRRGHSIEARIYAEDPTRNFAPDAGSLVRLRHPQPTETSYRFETGVSEGDQVSTFYDPMISKVVVHGADRGEAIARLQTVLAQLQICGVATNVEFIRSLLKSQKFLDGSMNANYIDKHYAEFLPRAASEQQVLCLAVSHAILGGQRSMFGSIGLGSRGLLQVQYGEKTFDLAFEGSMRDWVLSISDRPHRVKILPVKNDGDMEILLDGRLVKAVLAETDGNLCIFLDGIKYTVSVKSGEGSSVGTGQGERVVRSSMPARIAAVHVKAGDRVKAGDKLLVTEAMKMENVVKASTGGIVERVNCREGQLVSSGQVLVELRADN